MEGEWVGGSLDCLDASKTQTMALTLLRIPPSTGEMGGIVSSIDRASTSVSNRG